MHVEVNAGSGVHETSRASGDGSENALCCEVSNDGQRFRPYEETNVACRASVAMGIHRHSARIAYTIWFFSNAAATVRIAW